MIQKLLLNCVAAWTCDILNIFGVDLLADDMHVIHL